MESEVRKEKDDPHLQKPPKPEGKEKEAATSIHEPQSPNMDDGYDPNRIPSSVFSTKGGGGGGGGGASGQAEWSGTSNESLFSIQMGNSSFSNDYAIMYGKSQDFELNNTQSKSEEELPRLLDNNRHNNAPPPKSGDFTSLPPVMEQDEGSLQSGESSRVHTNQSPNAAFRTPASPQPDSRMSTDSNKSFAFPVLTNVSGKKEQSIKVEPEKDDERTEVEAQAQEQVQVQVQQPPPAQKPNKWFGCFSCSCCG